MFNLFKSKKLPMNKNYLMACRCIKLRNSGLASLYIDKVALRLYVDHKHALWIAKFADGYGMDFGLKWSRM